MTCRYMLSYALLSVLQKYVGPVIIRKQFLLPVFENIEVSTETCAESVCMKSCTLLVTAHFSGGALLPVPNWLELLICSLVQQMESTDKLGRGISSITTGPIVPWGTYQLVPRVVATADVCTAVLTVSLAHATKQFTAVTLQRVMLYTILVFTDASGLARFP